MVSINPIAIGLAAVATMAIGFAYYSPLILGKIWMKEKGIDKKKMAKMKKESNMAATYGLSFVAAIVTAIVMSGFVYFFGAMTWQEGATAGFLAWLGFSATTSFVNMLFGDKNMKLFMIDTGYQLLSMVAIGIIVTVI